MGPEMCISTRLLGDTEIAALIFGGGGGLVFTSRQRNLQSPSLFLFVCLC